MGTLNALCEDTGALLRGERDPAALELCGSIICQVREPSS